MKLHGLLTGESPERVVRRTQLLGKILLDVARIDRRRIADLSLKIDGVRQKSLTVRLAGRMRLMYARSDDAIGNRAPKRRLIGGARTSRPASLADSRIIVERGGLDESAPLHGTPHPADEIPVRSAHDAARGVAPKRVDTIGISERRRNEIHHRKPCVRPVPRRLEIFFVWLQQIS